MEVSTEAKKNKAFSLRRNGATLSQISAEIGVPKGTLSRWFKGTDFGQESSLLLQKNQTQNRARAIMKSKLSKEMKKKFSERKISIDGKKIFEKNKRETNFILGIGLYWSHGGKTNNYFQFTSSDEEKILVMIDWLSKFLKVSINDLRFRLFSPASRSKENLNFWAKFTGSSSKIALSEYKTEKKRKNVENKGVFQILCYNVAVQSQILYWQKLLLEYYRKN